MKIAVVTRMLRKDKIEGIGMFARETLKRIVTNHPEHEFTFLFDRKYDDEFIFSSNVKAEVVPSPARHTIQIAYWHQVALKKYLKAHRPDILISPDGGIPLQSPVPTLAVIHDINFEHFPKDLPLSIRWYYRYYYPRIAKAATRIVTVSEFCKTDISNHYHLPLEKIGVVYNAVSDDFKPLDAAKIQLVRDQYSGGLPYFLFVGSIHRRKNIEGMIAAFNQFRKTTSSNLKFILAGGKRWWNSEMEHAFNFSPFKNDILFTGRVNDDALTKLTASAFALLLVSKFEGFGIPIVEAMKCGVPVITSNVTALPEIAGDAAVLANPSSTESIAGAMIQIFQDASLHETLIRKGLERAKYFSWDYSAGQLWKNIEATVQH